MVCLLASVTWPLFYLGAADRCTLALMACGGQRWLHHSISFRSGCFLVDECLLIISAVQPDISPAMLRHLMLGTVDMVAFGYSGESGCVNAGISFAFDVAAWLSILFEAFMSDAGSVDANSHMNKHVNNSFQHYAIRRHSWLGHFKYGAPTPQWRLLRYYADGVNVFGISLKYLMREFWIQIGASPILYRFIDQYCPLVSWPGYALICDSMHFGCWPEDKSIQTNWL